MSASGLSVGSEVVPESTPMRKRGLGLTRIQWVGVFLAGVFVVSVLRVVTGANDIDSSGLLIAAFGLAVPIALAGLGGLWSERAGVVNIGLEGMMILGTWGAGFLGYHMGPWWGLVGAIVGGVIGGVVHAVATVTFGVDHIVSGVALNIVALGFAKYLSVRFFSTLPGGGPTQSPPLPELPTVTIPGLSDALGTLEQQRVARELAASRPDTPAVEGASA